MPNSPNMQYLDTVSQNQKTTQVVEEDDVQILTASSTTYRNAIYTFSHINFSELYLTLYVSVEMNEMWSHQDF